MYRDLPPLSIWRKCQRGKRTLVSCEATLKKLTLTSVDEYVLVCCVENKQGPLSPHWAECAPWNLAFIGQLNLGGAGPRGLPAGDLATVELKYSSLGSLVCFRTTLLSVPYKGALFWFFSTYFLTIQSWALSMMEPGIPLAQAGGQKGTQDQWQGEVTQCPGGRWIKGYHAGERWGFPGFS